MAADRRQRTFDPLRTALVVEPSVPGPHAASCVNQLFGRFEQKWRIPCGQPLVEDSDKGGMFKVETDDFSNQVSTFRDGNAQILTGFMFANHFASFWRAAAQGNYKPEIATIAGAFLFPGGIDALGDRADGLSTEVWWSPKTPFASSLTGQAAGTLAADWEATTGTQWTPVLGYTHAIWEVAIHALVASGDPKDREAVRSALASAKLETVVGPVDFTNTPVPGITKTPLVAGQWRRTKSGSHNYDLVVTYNGSSAPFALEDEFKLLSDLG